MRHSKQHEMAAPSQSLSQLSSNESREKLWPAVEPHLALRHRHLGACPESGCQPWVGSLLVVLRPLSAATI